MPTKAKTTTASSGEIPLGFCQCGCGQRTKIATQTCRTFGWIKGRPKRYVQGHSSRHPFRSQRHWSELPHKHPLGYCQCGCGHKTPIARCNNASRGWVKGMPMQYVHGHNCAPAIIEPIKHWSEIHPPKYPIGQCQCGCGQSVGVAKANSVKLGYIKGMPVRFVRGHANNGKKQQPKRCKVDGCPNNSSARGMCYMHYQRWQKYGDPGPAERLINKPNTPCSVDGCGEIARSNGFCKRHYAYWRKHGIPGPVARTKEWRCEHGTVRTDCNGYKVIKTGSGVSSWGGGWEFLHRVKYATEKEPLQHGDRVFFRDGNRENTSKANLILGVRSRRAIRCSNCGRLFVRRLSNKPSKRPCCSIECRRSLKNRLARTGG